MEARGRQSCWSGFYNVSFCFRQQLAQTFHYSLATNFEPEYASEDDYRMIELMHEEFVRHLCVDDSRRSQSEEQVYNSKLSIGLITALETVLEGSGALRFQDMSMLARVIDSFFVRRRPAAGLRNIINSYYKEDVDDRMDLWEQTQRYLFRGDFDEIRKLLRQRASHDLSKEFFRNLETILNPMYRVFGDAQAASKEAQFLEVFESYKRQAKSLLAHATDMAQKRQGGFQELVPLLRVLSGDMDFIASLRPQRWEELFLVYLTCVAGVTEDYTEITATITRSFPGFQPIDQMILDLLATKDVHAAVQNFSTEFPLYFVAHVVELFVNAYLLTNENIEEFDDMTYPEMYYSLYVQSLIHDTRVDFRIPCDYIISAIGTLPGVQVLLETALTSRMERQSVPEMITYCLSQTDVNLEEVLEAVLKFAIRKRLHHGRVLEAIPWLVHTKSKSLREEADQAVVTYILQVGVDAAAAQVRELPDKTVKDSFPLTFLRDYIAFRAYLQRRQIPEAAQLLIEFIVHKTAPKEFWPMIFRESTAVFESTSGQFTYHHFVAILDALDDISNPSLCRAPGLSQEQLQSVSRVLCQAALRVE